MGHRRSTQIRDASQDYPLTLRETEPTDVSRVDVGLQKASKASVAPSRLEMLGKGSATVSVVGLYAWQRVGSYGGLNYRRQLLGKWLNVTGRRVTFWTQTLSSSW